MDPGIEPKPTSGSGLEETSPSVVVVPAELGKVLAGDREVDAMLHATAATVATGSLVQVLGTGLADNPAELSVGLSGGVGRNRPSSADLISPDLWRLAGPPNTGEVSDGRPNWASNFPPEDLPSTDYLVPTNFPGFPEDGLRVFLHVPSVDPPEDGGPRSDTKRVPIWAKSNTDGEDRAGLDAPKGQSIGSGRSQLIQASVG